MILFSKVPYYNSMELLAVGWVIFVGYYASGVLLFVTMLQERQGHDWIYPIMAGSVFVALAGLVYYGVA